MAIEITMPKLGLTMEEGTVTYWLVKEGQPVVAGKPLLTVETDKVSIDVEAPANGILLKILVEEGVTVPISTTIAYIGEPGENVPEKVEKQAEPEAIAPAMTRTVEKQAAASPRESGKPVSISPIAKKMAVENNIPYENINGSGPGGRIVEDDIRKAIQEMTQEKLEEAFTVEKLSSIKRVTAQRMSESFRNVPHFYLRRQLNMEKMAVLKERLGNDANLAGQGKITFTDLMLKALAEALKDHPYLNAAWSDEGIRLYQKVNLGVAIAVTQGLVVAVIKDAGSKSLQNIALERATLVEKAGAGKLTQDDIGDGTFTLTNLGMYDIDDFSPIINPPQSGIVATGKIAEVPVVENHQVQIRRMMNVTLAADHRVVDGAQAAQFLKSLAELVEVNPEHLME